MQDHAVASSANTGDPVIGLSALATEAQAERGLGSLTHGPARTFSTYHVGKPRGAYVKLLELKNLSRFQGFRSGTKEIIDGTGKSMPPGSNAGRIGTSVGSSMKINEREGKRTITAYSSTENIRYTRNS